MWFPELGSSICSARGGPAAGHRPGAGPGREPRIRGHPRVPRPTSTTTTSPAAWPSPGRPARRTYVERRPTRSVRPSPVARRRRDRRRRGMRVRVIATPGHTFTTCRYVLDDATARVAGGVHRRVAAVRGDRAAGPARPGAHPDAGRAPSTGRPSDWPPNCPTTRRSIPPTGSAASARPPRPTRATASTIGQEKQVNPALTLAEEQYVTNCWPAWTPSRRTTRTWARPTRPGRTPSTCRRPPWPTPRNWPRASRRASGSSTCASRRAFAAGHVAGSLSFEHGSNFTNYLGWLIPWGTPLTLLGRLCRAGRRRPAGPGPDRHRPAGRARPPEALGSGRVASRCRRSPSRASPNWPRSATIAP